MRLTYLLLLLGCVLITLPIELFLGVRVYARPRRLLLALCPGLFGFVGWDLWAIAHQDWSFDPAQTIGVTLPGGMPLEELLFFVVVPICAVLTLEAVRARTGWSIGDEP